MSSLHWRAVLCGSFLVACSVAIWPPYGRNGEPGRIKLGLDLQGGTHLVLQVVPDGGAVSGKPPVAPQTVKEVIRVLERRVNQLGVAEPLITEYGKSGDQILVQIPGVKDVAQAKRLILSVAQLSLQIVEGEAPSREMLLRSSQGTAPPDLQVVAGPGEGPRVNSFYLLRREAILTGRDLKAARVGADDHGEPNVEFTLNPQGAAHFERETARNIGRRLAIVLDERVISAPIVEQAVGERGQIRGHFTAAAADDLAKLLRAGALPAKMRYAQELTVGASLGRDSVRAGIFASVAALLLITVFMLVCSSTTACPG